MRACSVEECDRPNYGHGLCKQHYRKTYPERDVRRDRDRACEIDGCGRRAKGLRCYFHTDQVQERRCEVPDCGRPHASHGYCQMHLQRLERHGSLDKPVPRRYQLPSERACRDCSGVFPIEAYRKNNRMQRRCPECLRTYLAAWHRDRRATHPEAAEWYRVRSRDHGRFARHGITRDDFERMLAEQDGRCAVCRRIFTVDVGPHIDHDHRCCPQSHSCGACVRGLLCPSCNTGIGHLGEDPVVFAAAAAYVMTKGHS